MLKSAEEIALDLITAVDITALPLENSERDQRVKELVATAYAVADVMADAIASTQAAREAARLASAESHRKMFGHVFKPESEQGQ